MTPEEQEENTLLQAAAGYKGTDNIRGQLMGESMLRGFSEEEAGKIVDKVLKRLAKTETGRKGSAFGVPHNPKNQLASMIAKMRY